MKQAAFERFKGLAPIKPAELVDLWKRSGNAPGIRSTVSSKISDGFASALPLMTQSVTSCDHFFVLAAMLVPLIDYLSLPDKTELRT